jgi:hypothetical protein
MVSIENIEENFFIKQQFKNSTNFERFVCLAD